MNPPVNSVFDLSDAEKLQLVQDLWDDLSATPESVPVHEWQKDELAKRKANLTAAPDSAIEWAEVKQRIRSRYAR
ncbi:MAG: addiction module protein [Bryobacteraceae bacterium]